MFAFLGLLDFMSAKTWTKEATRQVVCDQEARVAALQREIAAEKRAHASTLRRLENARAARKKAPRAPAPRAPKLRTGDIVEVIFSDVHGNQHEPAAFGALLGDIKALKPDRLFIGGDFINCGGFLAEHHTIGYVAETDDSYELDVAVSNKLLDALAEASGGAETHYLEGNHEWRVERWALTQRLAHKRDIEFLRRTFAPEVVLRLKERGITYYSQGSEHGCGVPGWVKRDKVFFVHKLSNATDAAAVAMAKAGGNVCYFDTHRAAFKPKFIPGIGLLAAWNPGCLCKRQPLYANTRPTEWTHGYLVRFISRRTGSFQMVNVTIDEGVSYGSQLLKHA
jgi:hypothetical protein